MHLLHRHSFESSPSPRFFPDPDFANPSFKRARAHNLDDLVDEPLPPLLHPPPFRLPLLPSPRPPPLWLCRCLPRSPVPFRRNLLIQGSKIRTTNFKPPKNILYHPRSGWSLGYSMFSGGNWSCGWTDGLAILTQIHVDSYLLKDQISPLSCSLFPLLLRRLVCKI